MTNLVVELVLHIRPPRLVKRMQPAAVPIAPFAQDKRNADLLIPRET
jgi:hypothetical protein